jgi:hypothetical protein
MESARAAIEPANKIEAPARSRTVIDLIIIPPDFV